MYLKELALLLALVLLSCKPRQQSASDIKEVSELRNRHHIDLVIGAIYNGTRAVLVEAGKSESEIVKLGVSKKNFNSKSLEGNLYTRKHGGRLVSGAWGEMSNWILNLSFKDSFDEKIYYWPSDDGVNQNAVAFSVDYNVVKSMTFNFRAVWLKSTIKKIDEKLSPKRKIRAFFLSEGDQPYEGYIIKHRHQHIFSSRLNSGGWQKVLGDYSQNIRGENIKCAYVGHGTEYYVNHLWLINGSTGSFLQYELDKAAFNNSPKYDLDPAGEEDHIATKALKIEFYQDLKLSDNDILTVLNEFVKPKSITTTSGDSSWTLDGCRKVR